MKGGVKGVFYNKVVGKFDVRLNRNSVTYMVGRFETYEEAVQARTVFLVEYEMRPPVEKIEKYSKKWWEEQARLQKNKFRELSL